MLEDPWRILGAKTWVRDERGRVTPDYAAEHRARRAEQLALIRVRFEQLKQRVRRDAR